jgi:hypothetical protein
MEFGSRLVTSTLCLALGTLAAGSLATAAPAPRPVVSREAVGIGSLPSGSAVLCGSSHTLVQRAATVSYTTPYAGVITSFAHAAGVTPAQIRLLALQPVGADYYLLSGSSGWHPLTPGTINTFQTRVPVPAGALLGIRASADGVVCATDSTAGNEVGHGTADPDSTATLLLPPSGFSLRLNLSAVVEPDVDGDGYGDVTQDACPASASSQVACPAPDTKVKRAPARRTTARTITVKFKASIEGSTFRCRLDRAKKAKPCTSPYRKRLGLGKHTLRIWAVSPAGIEDPTPAKVKVTIVRPS